MHGDYISSCFGKVRRSYYDAEAMLKRMKNRNRLKSKNQEVHARVRLYRCRVCKGWHIGSTDKEDA